MVSTCNLVVLITSALSTVADYQKTTWRRAKDNKLHDEKFITKGLWGVSRHPKYVHTAYTTPSQAPQMHAEFVHLS